VRYGVLGPLLVNTSAGIAPITGGNERVVLAVLAVHAGEAVSVDRLVDALWG
jgi:DNA-binding SARP family transcriptional activator